MDKDKQLTYPQYLKKTKKSDTDETYAAWREARTQIGRKALALQASRMEFEGIKGAIKDVFSTGYLDARKSAKRIDELARKIYAGIKGGSSSIDQENLEQYLVRLNKYFGAKVDVKEIEEKVAASTPLGLTYRMATDQFFEKLTGDITKQLEGRGVPQDRDEMDRKTGLRDTHAYLYNAHIAHVLAKRAGVKYAAEYQKRVDDLIAAVQDSSAAPAVKKRYHMR